MCLKLSHVFVCTGLSRLNRGRFFMKFFVKSWTQNLTTARRKAKNWTLSSAGINQTTFSYCIPVRPRVLECDASVWVNICRRFGEDFLLQLGFQVVREDGGIRVLRNAYNDLIIYRTSCPGWHGFFKTAQRNLNLLLYFCTSVSILLLTLK